MDYIHGLGSNNSGNSGRKQNRLFCNFSRHNQHLLQVESVAACWSAEMILWRWTTKVSRLAKIGFIYFQTYRTYATSLSFKGYSFHRTGKRNWNIKNMEWKMNSANAMLESWCLLAKFVDAKSWTIRVQIFL